MFVILPTIRLLFEENKIENSAAMWYFPSDFMIIVNFMGWILTIISFQYNRDNLNIFQAVIDYIRHYLSIQTDK